MSVLKIILFCSIFIADAIVIWAVPILSLWGGCSLHSLRPGSSS